MRTIVLSATALAAMTAAALAQTEATTTTEPAGTTATLAAHGPSFASLQATDMLGSNVIGLDIKNGGNETIGKIQDIAFDDARKVTGYILSVGGFLGMGTHYVAVDPGSVAVSYDSNNKTWRASMNATKDELKAAPEFKYDGQWAASRS